MVGRPHPAVWPTVAAQRSASFQAEADCERLVRLAQSNGGSRQQLFDIVTAPVVGLVLALMVVALHSA